MQEHEGIQLALLHLLLHLADLPSIPLGLEPVVLGRFVRHRGPKIQPVDTSETTPGSSHSKGRCPCNRSQKLPSIISAVHKASCTGWYRQS
jgi:hypothetical protein